MVTLTTPTLTTLKQGNQLHKRITNIKLALAAEKRKFGCYDDSRGLRYPPPRYYVQLADFKGGLTYLRWFTRNFADDAGFPGFLFECAIILFKNVKLKEAKNKAIQTYCSNIHLLDVFLDRLGVSVEPWEQHPIAVDSLATYFDSIGKQTSLVDFAEWLGAFVATERFRDSAEKFINLNRQLYGEHDLEKRRHLVEQIGQIARLTDSVS